MHVPGRPPRASRIATLAVGYADGYPRNLSNVGEVLLRGHRVRVIVRVTMDMIMVDASAVPRCQVGDEAVLIGAQGAGPDHGRTRLPGRPKPTAYEILRPDRRPRATLLSWNKLKLSPRRLRNAC